MNAKPTPGMRTNERPVSIVTALRRQLAADPDAADAIAAALIAEARKGSLRHAVEILNRIDGKVPDRIAVEDEPLASDLSSLSTDDLLTLRALMVKATGGPDGGPCGNNGTAE